MAAWLAIFWPYGGAKAMHILETILGIWIWIFSWTGNRPLDTLLWRWAGAASPSSRQPHDRDGRQPTRTQPFDTPRSILVVPSLQYSYKIGSVCYWILSICAAGSRECSEHVNGRLGHVRYALWSWGVPDAFLTSKMYGVCWVYWNVTTSSIGGKSVI